MLTGVLRHLRTTAVVAAASLTLLGGVAAAQVGGGTATSAASPTVTLGLNAQELTWQGPSGPLSGKQGPSDTQGPGSGGAADGSIVVVADTTGVGPSARSDLVGVELVGVRGPGQVAVVTVSPFGHDQLVLGTTAGAPARTVVQAGRRSALSWRFSEPGRYDVELAASVPTAAGTARTRGSLSFSVAEGGAMGPLPPAAATGAVGRAPAATGSAAAVTPAVFAAAADTATGRVVLSDGHVDMGPRIVDGAWRIQLKDDSAIPLVWRDLSDVVLHAVDAAKVTVPPGEQFGFLGRPGDPVWVLPQAQQQGILWPGWNTQDASVTSVLTGPVTWRILGVEGPGSFSLFLTGAFGTPEVIFDKAKPFPQQFLIEPNVHVHGSWAFGASGIYRFSVEMSAATSTGPVTDKRTLTYAVGAVDPQAGFGASAPGAAAGGSTTTTRASGASPGGSSGSSADQSIGTSRGAPSASTSSPSASGAAGRFAATGVDSLLGKVGLAGLLLLAGAACLWAARRRSKNKTYSRYGPPGDQACPSPQPSGGTP